MPFGGLLTGGISAGLGALGGLFGGGKQQTTKGTQDTSSHQTGSFNNTSSGTSDTNTSSQGTQSYLGGTTHQLSPFQQALAGLFTQGAMDQYKQSTDMSGYTAQGLNNINQTGDAARVIANNSLANRGLSYSPNAANVQTNIEGQRLGQSAQFLNSIPMVQRQLQQQSLGNLINAFQVLPTDTQNYGYGTTSNVGQSNTQTNQQSSGTQTVDSTGHTNQTGTVSGNPMGGLFGGLGAAFSAPGGLGGALGKLFGGGGGGSYDPAGAFGG